MGAFYLDIKKDLLDKILSGVYPQGSIIPNEYELAEIYKVSRPTIRKAVQILVGEGYLEKRKKRGTIVCDPTIRQEFAQVIQTFDQEVKEKGLTPSTKVLTFKKEKAGGLLMMMNGSPFVYYGEEIGMASKGSKDENKRIAMLWSSDSTAAGMTKGPSDADKDINSAFEAVDKQLKDKNSILNYYKRALRLRNENPEIARGEITLIDSLCQGHQAAITKSYNGSTIGIVYNTSDEVITVDISGTEISDMQIRGYLTLNNEEITLKDGMLTMPAQSICILKQR